LVEGPTGLPSRAANRKDFSTHVGAHPLRLCPLKSGYLVQEPRGSLANGRRASPLGGGAPWGQPRLCLFDIPTRRGAQHCPRSPVSAFVTIPRLPGGSGRDGDYLSAAVGQHPGLKVSVDPVRLTRRGPATPPA